MTHHLKRRKSMGRDIEIQKFDPDKLMSIKQAARYLGVTVQSVRQYLDQGLLTRIRIDQRIILIDLEEVEILKEARALMGKAPKKGRPSKWY
jgi:excisionase family DNA binding protein